MGLVMPSDRTAVPRATPQPTMPPLAMVTAQYRLTASRALASVTDTESPNTTADTGAGAAVVGGGAVAAPATGGDAAPPVAGAAGPPPAGGAARGPPTSADWRAKAAADTEGVDSRATGSSTLTASAPVTTTATGRYHDRGTRRGPLRSSTGRSTTTQLTAVASATDPRRAPSNAAPERPVRAWSRTMNSGQCHR